MTKAILKENTKCDKSDLEPKTKRNNLFLRDVTVMTVSLLNFIQKVSSLQVAVCAEIEVTPQKNTFTFKSQQC